MLPPQLEKAHRPGRLPSIAQPWAAGKRDQYAVGASSGCRLRRAAQTSRGGVGSRSLASFESEEGSEGMADIVVGPLVSEVVQLLREQVRGRVITAEDEGYDEARVVHNGMFDKRPRAVLKAEQVGDVIAAVHFAREQGLDLSVRGGLHSGPGFGTNDGGLVIDMSQMRTVRVDPRNKTARADAGATWGDFNHATHAFGLATTGGIISTTGISGLTLGGGIGYLSRGFGLTIDNLISADVV